jgi:hypothetical protein
MVFLSERVENFSERARGEIVCRTQRGFNDELVN